MTNEDTASSPILAVPAGGKGAADHGNDNTRTEDVEMAIDGAVANPAANRASVAAALPCTTVTFKATKAPKETLQAVYKAGEYKAGLPLNLLMVQSFMAGIYIAMAGQLYLTVGGGLTGAALFPAGLIAVILTSAELFTGDSLIFVAALLGQRVGVGKLLRNWTVAWVMNFCGCLFWAGLLTYCSDALADAGQVEVAIKVAEKKVHQEWIQIFLKGIGANFMVCIGVWQATCAEEVAGKVLAIWFPVAAFVAMGFDHCIANQFLIPAGMMFGADVSVGRLLWALFPATLGNVVGGGVMVGAVYWYVCEEMASSKQIILRIRESLYSGRRRASHFASTYNGSDDGDKIGTNLFSGDEELDTSIEEITRSHKKNNIMGRLSEDGNEVLVNSETGEMRPSGLKEC